VSRITVLITSAAICASAAEVRAGGMTPPVRDVRTVERAGARIAGADDADSLWLDPAGLAHLAGEGRTQLLFDIAYAAQGSTTPGSIVGEIASPRYRTSNRVHRSRRSQRRSGSVIGWYLWQPRGAVCRTSPLRRRRPAALRVSQPRGLRIHL